MSGTSQVDTLYMLKYIGSKRRMAGILAALIPPDCTTYVEPFIGSAALALNCGRKFERMVWNDLNAHMANFWRVATDPVLGPQLLEMLKQTRYSRTLFEQAKQRREDFGANRKDLVAWAVDTYVLNWMSFNALGDYWREGDPNTYMEHITSRLGLQLALEITWRQNVEVHNENAMDLLEESGVLSDDSTFIYLDPPYLEGLRCNGKLYQTDMPDICDHIDLLRQIKTAKAKILLSGYWSGRDDGTDLYDAYLLPCGWHRHCLGGYSKSCQSGTDEKAVGLEWVWTNYEIKGPMLVALMGKNVVLNAEQKSPCIREWLALQSHSPKGGRGR